jgi:hypothetical protein
MKFKREKVADLLEGKGAWVIFTEEADAGPGQDKPFRIIAGSRGVWFDGCSNILENQADLESLAKTISLAWKEHRALKPKLGLN